MTSLNQRQRQAMTTTMASRAVAPTSQIRKEAHGSLAAEIIPTNRFRYLEISSSLISAKLDMLASLEADAV